jgi:hypothetical protein
MIAPIPQAPLKCAHLFFDAKPPVVSYEACRPFWLYYGSLIRLTGGYVAHSRMVHT